MSCELLSTTSEGSFLEWVHACLGLTDRASSALIDRMLSLIRVPLQAMDLPVPRHWRRPGQQGTVPGQPPTYCLWMRHLHSACLAVMPTPLDAEAYMRRNLEPAAAAPSAANTLWHEQWQAAGGGVAADGAPAAVQELPDAAAWLAAAAPFPPDAAPVLFLGALPRLADSGALPALPPEYSACYLVRQAGDASSVFEYEEHARQVKLERLRRKSAQAGGAGAEPG